MTINEAAMKWALSPNWIRILIKDGRLKATFNEDGPVGYYVIDDKTKKPQSQQRAPFRKGTSGGISEMALQQRAYRARKAAGLAKPSTRKVPGRTSRPTK